MLGSDSQPVLPPPGFQQPHTGSEWPLSKQSPMYLQSPPGYQPYVTTQNQPFPYYLIRLNQRPWGLENSKIPEYPYHLIETPLVPSDHRRPAYMDAPPSLFMGPVVLPVAKVDLKEFGTIPEKAKDGHEQSNEVSYDDKVLYSAEATKKASNRDAETNITSSKQVCSPLQAIPVTKKASHQDVETNTTLSEQVHCPLQTIEATKTSNNDAGESKAASAELMSSAPPKRRDSTIPREQALTKSTPKNVVEFKKLSITEEFAEANLQISTKRITLSVKRAVAESATTSSSPLPTYIQQIKEKLHRVQHPCDQLDRLFSVVQCITQRILLGGEPPPPIELKTMKL